MSTVAQGVKPYYFVPQPSHWPILGSCALLLMGTGAAFWFNSYPAGPWVVLGGFCVLLVMLFGWFGTVIGRFPPTGSGRDAGGPCGPRRS